MARIRSIHPAIFTDEVFMGLCANARLLMIGLWCEAWDDGVFEWKPLTLKARIFPADPVDTSGLLAELTENNVVRRFEINGRIYGVIRNFQRFQHPRRPSVSGLLPETLAAFAGQGDRNIPDDDGNDGPPNGGIPDNVRTTPASSDSCAARREEGVGEGGKVKTDADASVTHARNRAAFDRFWEAYPHKVGKAAAEKSFEKIAKAGKVTLAEMLTALEAYKRSKPPDREWCNPTTWLNQARWLDQPAHPSTVVRIRDGIPADRSIHAAFGRLFDELGDDGGRSGELREGPPRLLSAGRG